MHRWIRVLLLVLGIIGYAGWFAPGSSARQAETPGLHITSSSDAVVVAWQAGAAPAASADDPLHSLQTIDYGGYELPAYLVPLLVNHNRPIATAPDQIQAVPWQASLSQAHTPIPQPASGEPRPDLATSQAATLPESPVFVLRDGMLRGQRLVVLAVSPFFAQAGSTYRATSIETAIPGARLLHDPADIIHNQFFAALDAARAAAPPGAAASSSTTISSDDHRIWLPLTMLHKLPDSSDAEEPDNGEENNEEQDNDSTPVEDPWRLPPINPLADQQALKITVSQAGMQHISGAMVAANGFALDSLNPAHLQVWHQAQPIAAEISGAADGRFDAGDELHFYAPPPGDRWNSSDTYWLTVEPEAGTRFAQRDAAPGSATLHTVAHTTGTWYQPTIYDTTLPGPDGDHWFATDMRSGPGQSAATLNVPLALPAPAVAGTSVFTLTGSAYTVGPHQMAVSIGSEQHIFTWQGVGDWQQVVQFQQAPQAQLAVALLPGTRASGVELDRISWEIPISLNVAGRGLHFRSSAEQHRYRIEGIAAGSKLYDISDPANPVRLLAPSAAAIDFEDPLPRQQRYLLAGPGTVQIPAVSPHRVRYLSAPLNAHVLYIAPEGFHAALLPLVEHRRSQGYTAAVVDVQAIYDTWSYGQVSPEAIRSFLRYATVHWQVPPIAAVLVGDGTADPLNYQGNNNANFIPPYLAYVDPWIGETACDTCYAQLEGESPLADTLPDMLIGRLPVKSPAEVSAVVQKILGYETGPADAPWRNRAIYLTDNTYDASGRRDPASDFIADANASIALQPDTLAIERLSYDPSPEHTLADWREPDQVRARDRTSAMLSQGAATVTYFGHGHEWQWALTNLTREPSHLIELYEVDTLSNGERLPVVLTMTCLTSSFQKITPSATVIDERFVLHPNGGAVAVWGPTGQGVAHGHSFLQQGFYRQLWHESIQGQGALGAFAQAGYMELFLNGTCCQNAIRTYVVLGDPLTFLRIGR